MIVVPGIVERLGVNRQTVYNHLIRKKGEPFPKPRPARPSLLDPFKDNIEARLERFDLPATVVLQEIKGQGYRGGLTILRDFVRPLKQEFVRRVTERFETLPGQRAQIDWGECGTIAVGGERKTLYVFVMVRTPASPRARSCRSCWHAWPGPWTCSGSRRRSWSIT